jgi:hypothetical protein
MPSVKSQLGVQKAIDRSAVRSICHEIRGHLQHKREQITTEIRNYPPPIPACDAQFNYLLEQRARIEQALSQLDALQKEGPAHHARIDVLDEFIQSSEYIPDEVKQTVRIFLNRALSQDEA